MNQQKRFDSEEFLVRKYIKKACINLFLDKKQSNYQKNSEPNFSTSLDHLGPLHMYFMGIDKKLGVLMSDSKHAISCHLTGPAKAHMKKELETCSDLTQMIGKKVILNPDGQFIHLSQEQRNQKQSNFKINSVQEYDSYGQKGGKKDALKLKIGIKRVKPVVEQDQKKIQLQQNFKTIIRLQINDFVFTDDQDLEEGDENRLIVKKQPLYIEYDPTIETLQQQKFIEMQRFELEKWVLKENQQLISTASSSTLMTNMEDLFDGSIHLDTVTIHTQSNIEDSNSFNTVPTFEDDDFYQSNQVVKMVDLTKKFLTFGFEKGQADVDLELLSSQAQDQGPRNSRQKQRKVDLQNGVVRDSGNNKMIFMGESQDYNLDQDMQNLIEKLQQSESEIAGDDKEYRDSKQQRLEQNHVDFRPDALDRQHQVMQFMKKQPNCDKQLDLLDSEDELDDDQHQIEEQSNQISEEGHQQEDSQDVGHPQTIDNVLRMMSGEIQMSQSIFKEYKKWIKDHNIEQKIGESRSEQELRHKMEDSKQLSQTANFVNSFESHSGMPSGKSNAPKGYVKQGNTLAELAKLRQQRMKKQQEDQKKENIENSSQVSNRSSNKQKRSYQEMQNKNLNEKNLVRQADEQKMEALIGNQFPAKQVQQQKAPQPKNSKRKKLNFV